MNAPPLDPRSPSRGVKRSVLAGPDAPAWAHDWLTPQARVDHLMLDGMAITRRQSGGLMLLSATIPQTASLGVEDFQAVVRQAYMTLHHLLAQADAPHPWRFWNFVPDILADQGDGLLRYMVFNAGRHQAMLARHGARDFSSAMVAASAVGMPGDELVIHLLSGDTPGQGIENPRQVSAFHYSPRYGPLPPCFARATKIRRGGVDQLLISGTASIVGEDSTHGQSLDAQCQEILANFTSLLSHAMGMGSTAGRGVDILSSLKQVRVYLPNMAQADRIQALLASSCQGMTHLELMPALVCRPELLVEIEALAALPAGPA